MHHADFMDFTDPNIYTQWNTDLILFHVRVTSSPAPDNV